MLMGLMKERFASVMEQGPEAYLRLKDEIDPREAEQLAEIDRYLQTIKEANVPSVLRADPMALLDEILSKKFIGGDEEILTSPRTNTRSCDSEGKPRRGRSGWRSKATSTTHSTS